jgi:galactokinase
MGNKNTAKFIDFKPSLKTTDVKIPDSVALVIANSVTPSPKLLTLGTRYNKRVVECKFGLAILATRLGFCDKFDDCPFADFDELQKKLGVGFDEMIKLVDEHLNKGGYTIPML